MSAHSAILDSFTPDDFKLVSNFILKNGDRRTYCNMFNDNPHYKFGELDVFLNPAPGGPHNHPQWNINCDPGLSDFNKIVIRTPESIYCDIRYDKENNSLQIHSDNMTAAECREKAAGFLEKILGRVKSGN